MATTRKTPSAGIGCRDVVSPLASGRCAPALLAVLGVVVLSTSIAGCGRSELDSIGPATVGGVAGHGGGGTGGVAGGLPQLPPSPGFLLCGSEICTTSSQQCCLGVGASGELAASCQRSSSSCTGASLRCDEPADCRTSEICCFGLLPPASAPPASGSGVASGVTLGSRCEARASCLGVGRLILCRKDSDCGPGGGVCCPGLGVPTCQSSCPTL